MNAIVIQAIKILASVILGSGTFERVLGVVKRWSDEKISGAQKRSGVLDELQVIGLNLSNSLANLAVELAVTFLKKTTEK